MKNLLSLAFAVRREIRDRDDVQLLRLLELAALVLSVPVIALMVALGGDHPADAGYWLMAGAFTLLVTLFVAGVVIQHIRASRANQKR
ncbi:hypothetical protein [Paraburkholderia kururiensis]|uniref:Transmembrane protein n=1 Tax=Paraburkholderia kururiensis TaxID=984307 RepID=A0ABZ0WV45_9BURK|nr:hypothetical protein [Paraburkholderia kururiensis]WQD81278.1 hypothetical protein U0042_29845 [Paraburkholderia kururiensis]